MGWVNFVDKFKRYGKLTKKEAQGLVISILVIAFILSFRNWGVDRFEFWFGITNLIVAIVLVALSFGVRLLAQKAAGLAVGHKVEYQAWIAGLFVGLIIAFFSNGAIWIFVPGGVLITHLAVHRLGRTWYGPEPKMLGWIAMTGPIANIVLAVIAKILMPLSPILFQRLMVLNIWLAIFTMLPIPPLDGLRTLFGSRYIYVFIFGLIIACSVLLYLYSAWIAILGGVAFAGLAAAVFFIYFDKEFKPSMKFKG